MATGNPTSFRLSAEAVAIIEDLAKRLGVKRSAVVELAVRTLRDTTTKTPKGKTGGTGR